jgi:hypothetical protein
MRTEVFEIRYPDGDFEVAATQGHRVPAAGDRLRRKGRVWRVTHTEGSSPVLVYVERSGRSSGTGARSS